MSNRNYGELWPFKKMQVNDNDLELCCNLDLTLTGPNDNRYLTFPIIGFENSVKERSQSNAKIQNIILEAKPYPYHYSLGLSIARKVGLVCRKTDERIYDNNQGNSGLYEYNRSYNIKIIKKAGCLVLLVDGIVRKQYRVENLSFIFDGPAVIADINGKIENFQSIPGVFCGHSKYNLEMSGGQSDLQTYANITSVLKEDVTPDIVNDQRVNPITNVKPSMDLKSVPTRLINSPDSLPSKNLPLVTNRPGRPISVTLPGTLNPSDRSRGLPTSVSLPITDRAIPTNTRIEAATRTPAGTKVNSVGSPNTSLNSVKATSSVTPNEVKATSSVTPNATNSAVKSTNGNSVTAPNKIKVTKPVVNNKKGLNSGSTPIPANSKGEVSGMKGTVSQTDGSTSNNCVSNSEAIDKIVNATYKNLEKEMDDSSFMEMDLRFNDNRIRDPFSDPNLDCQVNKLVNESSEDSHCSWWDLFWYYGRYALICILIVLIIGLIWRLFKLFGQVFEPSPVVIAGDQVVSTDTDFLKPVSAQVPIQTPGQMSAQSPIQMPTMAQQTVMPVQTSSQMPTMTPQTVMPVQMPATSPQTVMPLSQSFASPATSSTLSPEVRGTFSSPDLYAANYNPVTRVETYIPNVAGTYNVTAPQITRLSRNTNGYGTNNNAYGYGTTYNRYDF